MKGGGKKSNGPSDYLNLKECSFLKTYVLVDAGVSCTLVICLDLMCCDGLKESNTPPNHTLKNVMQESVVHRLVGQIIAI